MRSLTMMLRLATKRSTRKVIYLLLLWAGLCYLAVSFSGQNESSATNDEHSSTDRLLQKYIGDSSRELVPSQNKTPSLSEQKLAEDIQAESRNLPLKFLLKHKKHGLSVNKSCAKLPSFYDINYNNMYWQTLRTSNGTFHIYGAYYDNRTLVAMKPVIRLLGMINRLEPQVKTYCQLWFEDHKAPVFSQVFEYKYVWNRHWGNHKSGLLQPYLISCQVPPEYRYLVPESVSIVEKPCDMAHTILRVINNQPESGQKEDFAVCVKGLDFVHDDMSSRMVEWLELLFLVGANKVFLYDLGVHSNVTKILNYYQGQGRVEVTKMSLPGEQPNIPDLRHMFFKAKLIHKRQNELIPYNDCLYRNINRYKYIVLLDTDEIIIPKSSPSWKALMETIKPKALKKRKEGHSSYHARNVYFLDAMGHDHGWFADIPRSMHMLQHVYRSKNYTGPGSYIKSFHDTERVLTLHNHFPFACLSGGCTSYPIDTEDAHLQHYRTDCVSDLKKNCLKEYKNHTLLDTAIWRYREPLVARYKDTLGRLGLYIGDDSPT